MRINFTIVFFIICLFFSGFLSAQENSLEQGVEIEKKFEPYQVTVHHTLAAFKEFKTTNRPQYLKELWYFSKSFYVKRNYFAKGAELDEAMIDIRRFENYRKENQEAVVTLPGLKDVIVLLPLNKLIYKPQR